MANVLSLAMKINADASGFKLDPVQRALVSLGEQADKVTAQFDKFAGESEAATRAQGQFADQLQALQNALRDGSIGATRFAIEFEKLTKAANAEAAALERAARITEANITPQQRYERTVAELKEQLDAGRISQDTFSRAMDKAKASLNGASDSASKTDKNLASLNSNVSLLTKIEIGRALLDGFQALSGVFQQVTSQITSLVSSVNSSLDTLNDFSARTGIGVEALQGYSLAAKLAGVDTEAFGVAIQKLGVNIGNANPGDGFDKSLRGIGLSVTELKALAPEQQFAAIGEAISVLPTAADRAAAAVSVFGKQGAALAPLFREGAASIDELRDRAERLGIIVDEAQINNIADMNDAFDLVNATIQGIIGQVIGNLAPAVTAVVDEFLTFIESWQGAEGTGGTGIANAITDVLLTGAEALATVFDQFVGNFTGFGTTLKDVSGVFEAVVNTFVAVGETFRAVFNVFELIGNSFAAALGRFLEGLGSWVSSDLEQLGKDLQENARKSGEENTKQLTDAATNAATAVTKVFTGGESSPSAAGAGQASQFISGLRERLAKERAPEFKIETNIEKTRESFDNFFGGIIDQSSTVTTTMREFEAAVAAAQEDGKLTADEIERIEQLQQRVNAEIEKERANREAVVDASSQQVEEIDKIIAASLQQMRIESQPGMSSERVKAADNLLKIQQEIVRVEEQLQLARDAGDQAAIDAATSRLATLDQVAAREGDIASGAVEARRKAAAEAEKLNEKILAKQEQLLSKQFEIELDRARELATVRTGSIQVQDIRQGGISAFFETLKEDPAVSEARKQTKELETIRKEIAKLQAEKVDILAGTG